MARESPLTEFECVLLLLVSAFGFVGGLLLEIFLVRAAGPGDHPLAGLGGWVVMSLSGIAFVAGVILVSMPSRGPGLSARR